MERKLAEYRARKKKPAEIQPDMTVTRHQDSVQPEVSPTTPPHTEVTQPEVGGDAGRSGHWLLAHLSLLKVLLWLVLLGLFWELEFGLPFFLISLFYWLYEGLRSPKARQPGEMSAYSVFNPDCQPILGTLTAEQLEGEMGYRPMARR